MTMTRTKLFLFGATNVILYLLTHGMANEWRGYAGLGGEIIFLFFGCLAFCLWVKSWQER